jgi:hypothetical protein
MSIKEPGSYPGVYYTSQLIMEERLTVCHEVLC